VVFRKRSGGMVWVTTAGHVPGMRGIIEDTSLVLSSRRLKPPVRHASRAFPCKAFRAFRASGNKVRLIESRNAE
jgi:hypothetical protein